MLEMCDQRLDGGLRCAPGRGLEHPAGGCETEAGVPRRMDRRDRDLGQGSGDAPMGLVVTHAPANLALEGCGRITDHHHAVPPAALRRRTRGAKRGVPWRPGPVSSVAEGASPCDGRTAPRCHPMVTSPGFI